MRADREARAVAGEHRVGPRALHQLGEQRLLRRQLLGDAFDDEVDRLPVDLAEAGAGRHAVAPVRGAERLQAAVEVGAERLQPARRRARRRRCGSRRAPARARRRRPSCRRRRRPPRRATAAAGRVRRTPARRRSRRSSAAVRGSVHGGAAGLGRRIGPAARPVRGGLGAGLLAARRRRCDLLLAAPQLRPLAMPRIALIHALAHSVAPINQAFARSWPEAELQNLLDDSLSADLARTGRGLDETMHGASASSATTRSTGADAILFTCSAFGPCIEAVAQRHAAIPVLKPNEAMIEEAAASGRRIGLIASFGPTLQSMPREFPAGAELECESGRRRARRARRRATPPSHDEQRRRRRRAPARARLRADRAGAVQPGARRRRGARAGAPAGGDDGRQRGGEAAPQLDRR